MLSFLVCALSSGAAFAPAARSSTFVAPSARSSTPVCVESLPRRQAVAAALLAGAALAPTAALADENDDAMARIAAKNVAQIKADKENNKSKIAKQQAAEEEPASEKFKKIGLIAVGGTVLSVPL